MLYVPTVGAAWGGEKAVSYGLCDSTYSVLVESISQLIQEQTSNLAILPSLPSLENTYIFTQISIWGTLTIIECLNENVKYHIE